MKATFGEIQFSHFPSMLARALISSSFTDWLNVGFFQYSFVSVFFVGTFGENFC